MREFIRKTKTEWIWLGILSCFYVLYFLTRNNSKIMNPLCKHIVMPLEHAICKACSLTKASVGEILILILVAIGIFYIANTLRNVVQKKEKGIILGRFALNIACLGLTVYAGFCFLWGTLYATDSFQQQSGIRSRGATLYELAELTYIYVQNLSELSQSVPRDENGIYTVNRQEILELSASEYENVLQVYPFLNSPRVVPKAFTSSKALSYMDFTGFYFPFTGEANLNIDSPSALLASVAFHEMTHQCGISSEQECNFVGIVGSTMSQYPEIAYSGYLSGYIYLGNALHSANYELWAQISSLLPEEVWADLSNNNAYWAQFRGKVNNTAQKVYDGFLKANGDALGIQSYGTVVDMLVALYYDN